MLDELPNQEILNPARAGFYIDGFNLYHPLHELDAPHLKWVDLRKLGEIIIPSRSESLVITRYFSALRPDRSGSRDRHNTYLNALRAVGVIDTLGHYMTEPIECRSCRSVRERNTEKQTDLNMGLAIIADAMDRTIDHVYMLTADSDHAATARVLKERAPHIKLTSVAPPDRNVSPKIMAFADAKLKLTRHHIERSVFPPYVKGKKGFIRRPREYDTPLGWRHPDAR